MAALFEEKFDDDYLDLLGDVNSKVKKDNDISDRSKGKSYPTEGEDKLNNNLEDGANNLISE